MVDARANNYGDRILMNEVSYWTPPDENPNFISRPPDPGFGDLLKTVGWEALYHSPFYATYRWSQLTLEKDIPTTAYPVRKLDPDELTEKYGLGGQLKFDEPMYEAAAQLMYRRKIDENDRAYLIASGQNTGTRSVASFGVGMAATLLDPINFASMFIPVVGEARIARLAQRFGGGSALKERLVRGALTGAGGAAMVEPFILLPAIQEQANYDLRDSAINLGFGAALGGMLHAGLGAIGDRLRRVKPKDADTLFESAMNNVLKDEPVTAPAKVAEFIDELQPKTLFHGTARAEGELGSKVLFFTDDASAAGDYANTFSSPENPGRVLEGHVAIERPASIENLQAAIVAAGFEPNSFALYRAIAKHMPGDNSHIAEFGPLDAIYIPEVREQLKKAGFDGLVSPDPYLGGDIMAHIPLDPSQVSWLKPEPTLNDIPKRDARGKFLSKEKRLELLNEKIMEQQQAKQENRGQNVIEDTKEISSRIPKNDLGMTSDHAKDITLLEQDIAEIEKALDLTPEEMTRLREDIKAEAGDQPGREKGIVEGVKCIIKNLV